MGLNLLLLSIGLAAQPAGDVPLTERTEAVELHYGREDGRNTWRAGGYSGTWSGRGSSSNVFGVRTRSRSRVELTFAGDGSGGSPLTVSCTGGESEFTLAWITFDKQDLSYACNFSRDGEPVPDSRFELALQRRGLMGMGRNERAGEMHHAGHVLRFETQRLSGVAFPSGRVPGYVIRADGRDVGGMDYGVMRSTLYLPPDGDPQRESVLLAALILATFMDPANTGN